MIHLGTSFGEGGSDASRKVDILERRRAPPAPDRRLLRFRGRHSPPLTPLVVGGGEPAPGRRHLVLPKGLPWAERRWEINWVARRLETWRPWKTSQPIGENRGDAKEVGLNPTPHHPAGVIANDQKNFALVAGLRSRAPHMWRFARRRADIHTVESTKAEQRLVEHRQALEAR